MRLLLAFLLLCCTQQALAQHTLSGTVKDEATGQGLEYATVSLINLDQNKVQDGALTDSTGQFTLSNIAQGRYLVKADFIGYRQAATDTIMLKEATSVLMLPALVLRPDGHSLETVSITAQAPVVEQKIDKLVYNAAADVTAQGGIALDVLKKVPQVSVDADGNVELQGNPNIRFLINGKPSGIFGSSVTDALSAIPASEIASIEVISSPGARYDAQGTGGIINIVLKQSKAKGVSGSVSLSAGTRLENGAANLNYRNGDLSVHAFISGNAQINSRSPNSQDRLAYDATQDSYTRLLQDGYTDMERRGLQAGIGIDWTFRKNNVLSATIQYNDFSNKKTSLTAQQEIQTLSSGQVLPGQQANRNSYSSFHTGTLDYSLGYKTKLGAKGGDLEFLYSASLGTPTMTSRQSLTYTGESGPYSGSSVSNPGKDQQHYLSLDYSRPFSKLFTLEAGLKGSFQRIESDNRQSILSGSGQYDYAPGLSYLLHYNLSVYAGYLSATTRLGQWLDVKAGIRAEYTHIGLDYNQGHIPSYTTWVPTVILSHEFANRQVLKLAYSRRLERPEYEELNPFLNLSDPYNIVTGNPYLKPEIANNIELGYSRTFGNGINIYAALIERINTNDIKSFTAFYPAYTIGDSAYYNVSVTDKRNIGREYNSGLLLSGSVPVGALSLRSNIQLIHKHIVNDVPGASPVTNAFTARINLNAAYTLPAGFLAEAFGNYRSGFVSIQGKQPQLFTYTIALRKQFWNNRASAGITATNIFGKYVRQETTINTADYTSYAVRELPFRSVGLTFSYKFGKLDFGKKDRQSPEPEHLPAEN